MLEALSAWSHLSPLLAAAAELDSVPEGHLARTVRLREATGEGTATGVTRDGWELMVDVTKWHQ